MSGIFVLRPVMTTLVMASFLLFGLISYFSLPVSDLPAIDLPTITVSASLPGGSAETMAAAVATPLEKSFSNIAGLDSMTSSSQMGSTSITMQFDFSRSIDGAAEDVQAAIVAARPLLPSDMPTLPTFRKVNPADMPILYLSLSSPVLPMYNVDEYAENVIAPRISMINGVAQVQVYGSQIFAPHVQIDPRKLASYGVGIDQVESAIASANVNLPTGTLYGPDKCYNVMVNGQLFNAAALRPIIVTYRNGAPIRLSDVGDVIDSVQTDKVASWYNNTRAVILAVQRQPNTNTIEIVDNIRQLMPQFLAITPKSVQLDVMFDRSQGIRKSVDEVKKTLALTICLVVLVIFLFLGNLSATVISCLALPVSIIGSFAAMKLLNFTINNISLMALTLCVGFVVDDAIVVLENIVRHMELGESPFEAALKGAKEIGFTILSMTISLVAVFIPILLMGGLIGRLFFEFAVTISVAIIISGFASLSLTPMLCSRFLHRHTQEEKRGLHALSERFFDWLLHRYERSLKLALAHRRAVVALFAVMLVASAYLLVTMPKGFMPSVDTGQVSGSTQAQEGISFVDMVRHQKKLADIVAKDPSVQSFMSSVGPGGPNSSANQGRLMLFLKPIEERKLTADEVIQELRHKMSKVPGIRLYMQNPPSIRMGGHASKSLYQLSLSGSNLPKLYQAASQLEAALHRVPEITDLNSDLQNKNLELNVHIDRDKCAQLGLSVQRVQNALNSAYAARQVSVIYTSTNQYWIILEANPRFYQDPSMLQWLRVSSSSGQLIPLDTVATVSRGTGPLQVTHLGQFPCVTLSFNVKPGVSLGQAVERVKKVAAQTLPSDITFDFEGNAQMFESSTKNLGALFVIALLVIYIVLGMLYESYIHPLTILSGLPSAGLGALLTLMAFHRDLDIYGFLGLILLVGIVKKNAIMMIDFAIETQRQEKKNPEQAIYEACLVRFRPIMMTTLAALLGSLPIALATGPGSETRQPLGLTIVGGLLLSQVVTLYITPVFYLYLEKLTNWWQKRKSRHTVMEGAA